MAISVFAPAKINLTLSLTGRREDGYHLLDSLVAFADIGDRLTFSPSPEFRFRVEGDQAIGFTAAERDEGPNSANLIVRAIRDIAQHLRRTPDFEIRLNKVLPMGAGLGGGSADAAAAIWGALDWWQVRPPEWLPERMLQLGADVPVCFPCQPARMRGIGEQIELLPGLPELPVVLVWPGKPCATADVFRRFKSPFLPETPLPPAAQEDADALIDWLSRHTNSLTQAATEVTPVIAQVLSELAASPSCRLARMSGSGSACFGLFQNDAAATAAAKTLRAGHPDWWVQSGSLNRPTRY